MDQQPVLGGLPRGVRPEQAFERATTLHRRGRLREAEEIYRVILDSSPEHFGALYHLGLLVGIEGRTEESEYLTRRALEQNPDSAPARINLGMLLSGSGRFDQAISEYEKTVQLDPHNVEARNNLGNLLHMLDRSGEAIPHFERAIAARPDIADLHNNLGNAFGAVGRYSDALASFGKTLEIVPEFAEARNNIGVVLAATGRYDEAILEYMQAVNLRENYFEAHSNLADALAALDRHDEAIEHYESSIAIQPDAGTLNNLGNLLVRLGRHSDAIAHYTRAIGLRPSFAEAHNNLGNVIAFAQPADAMRHFQRAIEINSTYADAHSNLGNVLGGLGRYDEAIASYRRAIALAPDLAETHYCLGNALITVGQISEGRTALERAVALAPGYPEFYRSLGECKRFTADDPDLRAMERLAEDLDALTEDQRIILHFALAKAYEDINHDAARFLHLQEGNRLKRAQCRYDEAATLGVHDRVTSTFTAELIRSKTGSGDPSALPIFVLGMPRSGTTLIEQVLASHPRVFGAGEILALHDSVHGHDNVGNSGPLTFPETMKDMSAAELRRIGEDYLTNVRAKAPGYEKIVDKALGNFVFAGLIHLALPNARIIHARRNPVDTCLSNYSKLFASELLYTYDLGELGRYYRSYDSLMRHWRDVLPDSAILDVDYEDMVSDFEAQARRIVGFCGLEWNEQCLAFHQTQRPVRTASATQVRRPIYQTSIGRASGHEPMLQPLIEELNKRE